MLKLRSIHAMYLNVMAANFFGHSLLRTNNPSREVFLQQFGLHITNALAVLLHNSFCQIVPDLPSLRTTARPQPPADPSSPYFSRFHYGDRGPLTHSQGIKRLEAPSVCKFSCRIKRFPSSVVGGDIWYNQLIYWLLGVPCIFQSVGTASYLER